MRYLSTMACALTVLPLPLLAQTNGLEGAEATLPCPGPAHAIALAPSEFIELNGTTRHLTIGSALRLCFTETDITLFTPQPVIHPCTAIRDSTDGGTGHYFTAEGMPYHVWLFINPDTASPTLEIGLYREDDQLVWIDTAAPICAG